MSLKMCKLYQEAVIEQFRRVGLDYTYDQCLAFAKLYDNWYWERSWSVEEQADFKDWLTKRLRKITGLHKEYCEREAGMFILNVGWKLSEVTLCKSQED